MNAWLIVASLAGSSGVLLGAFGAHGLRARLTPEQLGSWETAVMYQLVHALALLALALAGGSRNVLLPALLFSAGILLFSGSIYALVLGGPRFLGPVTPLGGVCLVAGWLSLVTLARA